jgi:hypothetical protein
MMIHDVRNNQIGELNVFVRVNHADLECRQDSLAETPSPAILFPLSLLDVSSVAIMPIFLVESTSRYAIDNNMSSHLTQCIISALNLSLYYRQQESINKDTKTKRSVRGL